MSESTHEKARAEIIAKMGDDLGLFFDELFHQVAFVHFQWNEFCELFRKSKDQIDLLNAVAPQFFGMVQASLYRDILAGVCRVTDPPAMRGHRNLTVRTLPELVANIPAPVRSALNNDGRLDQLQADLAKALDNVETKMVCIRHYRNKVVSHSDLSTHRAASILPAPEAQQMKAALDAVAETMNIVAVALLHSGTSYDAAVGEAANKGGAGALVGRLRALRSNHS